MISIFKLAMS